jgi:hypothetical protein
MYCFVIVFSGVLSICCQIVDAFVMLKADARSPALKLLLSYLDREWLKHGVWTPRCWSVFNQSIRTNNEVEGTIND